MKKLQINFIGEGEGGGGSWGGYAEMGSGIFKSAMGVGQLIAGGVKNSKAKLPQEVDPSQTNMLDTLRRLRKGYQSGSEAASYRDSLNSGLATANNAAANFSGGNTGTLINALSTSANTAGVGANQMAATLEKNRLAALTMESQATDNIAQRRLDIQMAKYLQDKASGTSNMKAGLQNLLAGGEEIAGGIGANDENFTGKKKEEADSVGNTASDTMASSQEDTDDQDKLAKFEDAKKTKLPIYTKVISPIAKGILGVIAPPVAAIWAAGDGIGELGMKAHEKKLQKKADEEWASNMKGNQNFIGS